MADEENTNENEDGNEPDPNDEPTPEEVARDELRNLKKEAKEAKRRATVAERELEKLRAASPEPDDNKTQAELAKERERAEKAERRIRELSVTTIAAKMNAVDPDVVGRFIEWDEISNPDDNTEIERAVKDILKEKPYLVKGNSDRADAGEGGDATGKKGDMNALIRGGFSR